jgi:predicted RNase H-like HicB family nuclease
MRMSTVLFVALVSGDHASGYRARFPDIEDCSADGQDLTELLNHARQALAARLEALEGAGEAWPTATPIEEVASDPGAIPIPVDISVDDPPIRVNISLGERLVQRLDAAAESRGMTRSGFIAQAVRVSLGERTQGSADFEAVGRRLHDELNALGHKINESIGPESAFSRRMAELDDQLFDGVRRAADSVSAAMTRRQAAAKAPAQDADGAEGPATT